MRTHFTFFVCTHVRTTRHQVVAYIFDFFKTCESVHDAHRAALEARMPPALPGRGDNGAGGGGSPDGGDDESPSKVTPKRGFLRSFSLRRSKGGGGRGAGDSLTP